jgi:hypothetical protein
MPINVRTKGKAAESEFVNRFQMFFPMEIKRNLLQTREGGADISGCHPFCIEVKRCEKIERPKWWKQVLAATAPDEISIVAFRVNKGKWTFLLPVYLMIPGAEGYVEASEEVFLKLVMSVFEDVAATLEEQGQSTQQGGK